MLCSSSGGTVCYKKAAGAGTKAACDPTKAGRETCVTLHLYDSPACPTMPDQHWCRCAVSKGLCLLRCTLDHPCMSAHPAALRTPPLSPHFFGPAFFTTLPSHTAATPHPPRASPCLTRARLRCREPPPSLRAALPLPPPRLPLPVAPPAEPLACLLLPPFLRGGFSRGFQAPRPKCCGRNTKQCAQKHVRK